MQNAMNKRRNDIDRVESMQVKVTRVSGRVRVIGTGEVTVDVDFPVRFREIPIFLSGSTLGDNYTPAAGRFPTLNATVVNWVKRDEVTEGGFGGYYVGATIAIVVSGSTDQHIWLNWCMEGKAVRNPLNTIDDGQL